MKSYPTALGGKKGRCQPPGMRLAEGNQPGMERDFKYYLALGIDQV